MIAGATAVDIISQASSTDAHDKNLISGSTAPGKVTIALGGVARNVAETIHRLLPNSRSALLVSPVGDDGFAELVKVKSRELGMRVDGFIPGKSTVGGGRRTPVCNMVLDSSGDLVGGVADFSAVEEMEAHEVYLTLAKFLGLLTRVNPGN